MRNAETFLVIFLSAALAAFLTLAIIIAVKVKKILEVMQRIADKAEHLVDQAESVGQVFKKTAAPVALGRLFAHVANAVFDKKDKKET